MQAENLAKNIQSRLGEVAVSVGQAVSRQGRKLKVEEKRKNLFLSDWRSPASNSRHPQCLAGWSKLGDGSNSPVSTIGESDRRHWV